MSDTDQDRPDGAERSLALQLVLQCALAVVAAGFVGVVVGGVRMLVDDPSDGVGLRKEAAELLGLALWIAFIAGPGCWIHALVMGAHTWTRHRVRVGATVIPELVLGAVFGVAVAVGYLTLDVHSLRPDAPVDWMAPMRIAVLGSGAVTGAALGAGGGAIARRSSLAPKWSWVTDAGLIVVSYLVAAPLLGLFFTFAYETERTGVWEAIGSFFVFLLATGFVGAGVLVHALAVVLLTAAHQHLLGGKLTALVDAFVGAVWAVGVCTVGIAALEDGFENFREPSSLAVAVLAAITFGAVMGLAWGRVHRQLRLQRS